MRAVQAMLALYGYGVEITGIYDRQTRQVVAAFQRHFRPERVDGEVDFFDDRDAEGAPRRAAGACRMTWRSFGFDNLCANPGDSRRE